MNGRIHLHSINNQYGNVGQGRREMIVRHNKTGEALRGNGQVFSLNILYYFSAFKSKYNTSF